MTRSTNDIPAWVRYLAEAGRLTPSADNSQPWRFVFDGHVLGVEFEPSRGGALGQDHPAVLLAFGALEENLRQAAAHAGIDTTAWRPGDFPAGERLLTIPAPPQSELPDAPPAALSRRHTNRAPFRTEPLPENLKTILAAMTEGNIRVQVFDRRDQIHHLADLVRRASRLRFQSEKIHRWLAQSLRFTPEEAARGDGLAVETLALPPGGKALSRLLADWRRQAFLNRFGIHRLLARIEASQLTRCGALVALTGPADEAAAWLAAGRLLQRVWLRLTEDGIAVHPYFVLPDLLQRLTRGDIPAAQREFARRTAAATRAFLGEPQLFMLLRTGVPRKTPPRAARLPLEAILTLGTANRRQT